jgi:hypothetical protein
MGLRRKISRANEGGSNGERRSNTTLQTSLRFGGVTTEIYADDSRDADRGWRIGGGNFGIPGFAIPDPPDPPPRPTC